MDCEDHLDSLEHSIKVLAECVEAEIERMFLDIAQLRMRAQYAKPRRNPVEDVSE